MSIDKLQKLIFEKQNPTVVGLDPRPDYVPQHLISEKSLGGLAEAYLRFNRGIIDAVCDIVPAVKPQSACYEQLGWEGVRALKKTIDYAKSKGLYVIGDIKRGDIGSTAEAYSEAYLGKVKLDGESVAPFNCDAVTVNAYLGSDGILPFVKDCREYDKAIFALVKTSNKSSEELQDLDTDGRKLYYRVAELIEDIAIGTEGEYGYSCIGAVVGATWPGELTTLRKRFENTFFLVPGFGAQGATAKDIVGAFDSNGGGAIINSSRGIICAWKKSGSGENFAEAARNAAIEMQRDLMAAIK